MTHTNRRSVSLLRCSPAFAVLAFIVVPSPGIAADLAPPQQQCQDFVRAQARALHEQDRAPATKEEWLARRAEVRAALERAWGGFPETPCPLEPQKLGEETRDGYRFEKWIFQTLPGVWMTAFAYVPEGDGPHPAILQVHGHWKFAKQDPVVQSRCIGAAKLGFFVLAVEAFGAGERGLGKQLGEYHGEMVGATLFPIGRPLSGLQVYENMRAVDYLQSRPEVDRNRIGITGASGGGNQTMYAGAFDERFGAVVPCCSVGTYDSYLTAACCMCEVVPGALRATEEWGVLGLVAPRGLMIISATKDAFQFSVGEAQKSLAFAQPVFAVQGDAAKLRHTIFDWHHDYSQAMREAMYGWMTLQLKGEGDGSPIPEPPLDVQDPERIRCFPNETRPDEWLTLPQFAAREGRILVDAWKMPADATEWSNRAEQLRTTLIEQTFGGFPAESRLDVGSTPAPGKRASSCFFEVEPGLELSARVETGRGLSPPIAVLLDLDGAEAARSSPLAAELHEKEWTVVTVDLRATGAYARPNDAIGRAPDHNTAQWAMWIGRPLLGQWTYDVLRLVEALQSALGQGPTKVTLIGNGPAGLVALCAAAVDRKQRIAQVAAIGTLASYVSDVPYEGQRVGILAPGIVRDVGDVPQLAALVLPRRVVIAGGVSGSGQALNEEQMSRAYDITRKLATMTNQPESLVIRANSDNIASDLSLAAAAASPPAPGANFNPGLGPLAVTRRALAPWAVNQHASDVPKRHVQEIGAREATYVVVQGGTMDGQNCRSPQGVWQPFAQTWESNRSVRLENTGTSDVVNPWLSNGRNDFRSLAEIVARVVKPGMTDREIAMALWWQEIQHRFHYEGDNQELLSPVKVFNVYGHNTCGNDSICLAGQWKQAGLKVAPARVVGHCVTQVFYDGGWHLFDGDMHSMYLQRDNETVAGEQDIVRDHDLVRRTHTQGILEPQRRAGDEWASSVYVFEADVTGDRNADAAPDMNMTLRPGEALVWRWGHVDPVKYHGNSPPRFPDRICNGLWEYRPDFSGDVWRQGATTVEGIQSAADGLSAEPGQTGTIIWKMHSPYVFVGGKLDVDLVGSALFAVSWDGQTWDITGPNLDDKFPPRGPARYEFYLRCQLTGAARLRRLAIINDLQMAPLTLPGMAVGPNTFVYTDHSAAHSQVRLTHEWVERSAFRPPTAPPQPVYPPDGGEAEGTDIVFEWQPPADRDGDVIADYHFELSSYSDMRYPMSMTFARLISRTPDAGQPRFTLTPAGQLNPNQMYYWHVRAQDGQGVWGPWSDTWSFTPRGPGVPLAVTLDFDGTRGVLRWQPNPRGRAPAAYRVYGSDEKGFSISDEPYPVSIGISQDLPETFAANFIAEVRETELPVVGVASGSVGRPATTLVGRPPTTLANKAYYRVVAVDAAGRRSGPSDYAAAPRPFIFSQPPTTATIGKEFEYSVATIRSLGDLRMRMVGGKETTNFWDIERPRYRLERGPEWLVIDEATGRMGGRPDGVGRTAVVVGVTLERELRRLDGEALKWGVEKMTEEVVEAVGRGRQEFVVEVRR